MSKKQAPPSAINTYVVRAFLLTPAGDKYLGLPFVRRATVKGGLACSTMGESKRAIPCATLVRYASRWMVREFAASSDMRFMEFGLLEDDERHEFRESNLGWIYARRLGIMCIIA